VIYGKPKDKQFEILNSILEEENRKSTRREIQNLVSELNHRTQMDNQKEQQKIVYRNAPDGIQPIYDKLEQANDSSLQMLDSTIKFIRHND